MALVLGLIYVIGFLATAAVGRSRVGLSQWGRLPMGMVANSFPWFMQQVASMFLWPIFLVVWLVRGRPESPWQLTTSRRGNPQVVRAGR